MFRRTSVILALAFAAALLGSAVAAEPPTCSGTDFRDLGAAWRERLERAETKAATVRNGEGTFWRITPRGGGAPSHLLGTLHVTDPAVTTLPPVGQAAFDAANVVALENRTMLEAVAGGRERGRWLDRLIFTDGRRLTDLLSEADVAVLRRALDARGLPLWAVVGFKPWMVTFGLLQYAPCEVARMKAGIHVLDHQLYERAVAAGKKTADLEDFGTLAARIDGTPLDAQILLLRIALKEEADLGDRLVTSIRLWREGRVAMILKLLITDVDMPSIDPSELREAFANLLDRRNGDMFEHAVPLVEAGGAFLAVGAGHLVGDTGLVARFQDAGYEVARVE